MAKIKVIYGAPLSGKSTYIKNNLDKKGIRFDYDLIEEAITNKQKYEYNDQLKNLILDFREKIIDLETDENIYISTTNISNELKELLKEKDYEIIEMDANKQECISRLEKDDERINKAFWMELIEKWFERKEGKEVKNFKFKNEVMVQTEEKTDHLYLYGSIGQGYNSNKEDDLSISNVVKALAECKSETLIVHVNSPGGNVFESFAIANTIKSLKCKTKCVIEGIAASAATIISLACNEVYIYENAQFMIHNAWTFIAGNAEELRKTADDLERTSQQIKNIYLEKFNGTEEELNELMNNETLMTAEETLTNGFVNKIIKTIDEIEEAAQEPEESKEPKNEYKLLAIFQKR